VISRVLAGLLVELMPRETVGIGGSTGSGEDNGGENGVLWRKWWWHYGKGVMVMKRPLIGYPLEGAVLMGMGW